MTLEDVCADAVGGSVYRVRARVANWGEISTHVTNKGRGLRPVRMEFHPSTGVDLLSAEGHVDVGHLARVTGSRMAGGVRAGAEGQGRSV